MQEEKIRTNKKGGNEMKWNKICKH